MTQPQLDPQGHLDVYQHWTPDIAQWFADQESVKLTEIHWALIRFMREYYQNEQAIPPVRQMVKFLKTILPIEQANSLYLQSLFSDSPARQASRIAGLPKPAWCI